MKHNVYSKFVLFLFLVNIIEYSAGQSTLLTPGGAAFDNNTNFKTIQLPKLTYEQIKSNFSSQVGSMVYDISSQCVRVFNGAEWVCLADNKSTPFAAPGYLANVRTIGSIDYHQYSYNGIGGSTLLTDMQNNLYLAGSFNNIPLYGFGCTSSAGSTFGYRMTGYIIKNDVNNQPLWCFTIPGKVLNFPPSVTYSDFRSNISSIKITNEAIYVLGHFNNTITLNGIDIASAGGSDIFIAKLNPDNGNIIWFKKITNGIGDENAISLQVDGSQNLYISGNYNSNFSLDGITNISSYGGSDFFIAKFNSNGILQNSINSSGSSDDRIVDIEWVGSDLVAVGTFVNSITVAGTTLAGLSGTNLFLARISSGLVIQGAYNYNTTGAFSVQDVCNSSNGVYISGAINGVAQFGSVAFENTGFLANFSVYSNYTSNILKLTKGTIAKIMNLGSNTFGIINFSGNSSFDNIPIVGTFRDSDVAIFKIEDKNSVNRIKWVKVLGDKDQNIYPYLPYYDRSSQALLIKSPNEVLFTISESLYPSSYRTIRMELIKYVD